MTALQGSSSVPGCSRCSRVDRRRGSSVWKDLAARSARRVGEGCTPKEKGVHRWTPFVVRTVVSWLLRLAAVRRVHPAIDEDPDLDPAVERAPLFRLVAPDGLRRSHTRRVDDLAERHRLFLREIGDDRLDSTLTEPLIVLRSAPGIREAGDFDERAVQALADRDEGVERALRFCGEHRASRREPHAAGELLVVGIEIGDARGDRRELGARPRSGCVQTVRRRIDLGLECLVVLLELHLARADLVRHLQRALVEAAALGPKLLLTAAMAAT